MSTAARHPDLPTAWSITITLTPAVSITLSAFLVLLSILAIANLRLKPTSSARLPGGHRSSHILWDSEKGKPASLAEEELGPVSTPRQPEYPEELSPAVANDEELFSPGRILEEAPVFTTTMAAKTSARAPSPPSVLRPTARPPTPHMGSSATIALAQGRYTGVFLPPPACSSSFSSSTERLPQAVEAWRGIPYAQSTAGANRFRPPVPLTPDQERAGVQVTADRFGQICPGSIARMSGIAEGEDCLNLNVYRPASWWKQQQQQRQRQQSSGEKGKPKPMMPVLVYVHGGAFNGGMGVERDMASFVGWAATPILGINFNYRVGALGFPSSVAADGEGCLNLGLRDQRLLFAWVRENAGAFGGDVTRITVMGLSAGAHSIGYHLQSPSSLRDAPFHAAILESGGSTARATLAPNHPRTVAQWNDFLRAASIDLSSTNVSSAIFDRLRDLPLETILAASNAVFSRYQDPVRWPFQPTIETPSSNNNNNKDNNTDNATDDGIITALPVTRFRAGEFLRIPILTGFNTNEGSVFCNPATDTPAALLAKFTTMLPGLNNPPDLAALAALYPDPTTSPPSSPDAPPYARVPPGFGRQWARYEAAYAHYAYICPVIQTAHFYSTAFYAHATGGGGEPDPPVWVYHFAARARAELGGLANHGDEAVVVAHDMGAIGACPGLVRTSEAMHGAWVRFVVSGDPNRSLDLPSAKPSHNNNNNNNNNTTSPSWPRFNSPFIGDTSAAPGQLRRKPDDGSLGKVMLFGEGNDERCGGARNPGTPAQVVRLTEHEVQQCRFWWERVELSEGMGRRSSGGGGPRARL
ncbi:unnamed protein product [Discula destructiva]